MSTRLERLERHKRMQGMPTEPGYYWVRPLLSTGEPNTRAKWRMWKVIQSDFGLEARGLAVRWHEMEWHGPIPQPAEPAEVPE